MKTASSLAKDGYEVGGVGERACDSVSASFLLKQFLKACGSTVNREAGFLPSPSSRSRQAGNSKLSEMDAP